VSAAFGARPAAPPPANQLAPVLEAGGPLLGRLLARCEARLREVADAYGEPLGQHAAGTLVAGGKRLRPMLVFLSGGAADSGELESRPPLKSGGGAELVRAGAAVELLHMATLVHDDVLDRAALRRGRPTVYRAGGRTAAAATGDLLFSRAFAELADAGEADAVRALSGASIALARGELMQRADAWRTDVTSGRYLERCVLKTARLFAAGCRLGALLGRPGPGAAGALDAFGERIGIAFQIFDDVLDVSGPAERTGKRRGTDLLDGTVTLPLILARRRDPELKAVDLREAVTDPACAEAVCDRIARTGALGEAREVALHHVSEAKAALVGLELPEGSRRALDLVADAVVERYS
jgi:geranylgeranyl pyrophosphate synthase